MHNKPLQHTLPNLNRTVPLSLKNFALQAIPDASITVKETPDGWVVALAKPHLSAVLVTDRGAIKFFARLDTAASQLKQIGIEQFMVMSGGLPQ